MSRISRAKSTYSIDVRDIELDGMERRTSAELLMKSPTVRASPKTTDKLAIHERPIEDVVSELSSHIDNGLSAEEAAKRFAEDGPNELEKPPRISLLVLFIIQLKSVIMYLLMGAVVASAVIKATGDDADDFLSYIDSIAITIIVLVNATIAAVTENSANDALEALSSLQSPVSTVIRGGQEVEVESRELVRGDIVKLGTGDVVPADVRCIKANDFRVNEMLLTGEPEDVTKTSKVKFREPGAPAKLTADNMAFSSCNVKAGAAVGIVVAIGMKTRVGTIAALLNDTGDDDDNDNESAQSAADIENGASPKPSKKKKKECLPDTKAGQSPLQHNLEALAVKLGYMAIAVCVVVFVVGLALDTRDPEDPDTESWLFMVLVAVTLTVAAIPEGLPLCVTISLSSGCSQMVKENVLMRKIAAVETLGSASIICTDKTGTLTEGKMTLVAMFTGGKDYTVSGKGFDPTVGGITAEGAEGSAADVLSVRATLESAILCSNTTLKLEEDEETGVAKWTPRGNSSEAPLVVAGHKIGVKLEEMEQAVERVTEVPFSSSRKMMLTVTKTNATAGLALSGAVGEHTAHIKGAPNYILDKCTTFLASDGTVKKMDANDKQEILDKVDELSSQALRVLAIATRPLGPTLPFGEDADPDSKFSTIVDGLTLCGLCASIDPERDGVDEAVQTAKTAGVRVVMITGDYLKTAIAIAKNIGILDRNTFVEGNGEATDCGALRPGGKDGAYLPDQDFDALTRTTSVFARAKPEDKLEIVKSLQRQGWVCAMTGDGVNDAPALQRADIGVAMGLEGTEVAKGASDMILTDDNFCSIVKAIEKGRVIYAGIQKFVSFIMSVHFAEVVQIFACIVTKIPVMRQPLQILFLILVTDLPPSIALGFEPGEALTMKRAPRPKKQPVVLGWMWRGIVANGMILTACIFGTYMFALWVYAGAFLSEDITDLTREHCAIWPSDGAWAPELKIDCGQWSACLTNQSTGDCATWQTKYAAAYAEPDEKIRADAVVAAHTSPIAPGYTVGAIYKSHGNPACEICIDQSIRRARTCAFISLVWAENFRAFCSRSFENGVWVGTFSNPKMNKAILMAQASLYIALWLPGLNEDVLGLYVDEIHGFGWVIAISGAFSCLIFCELYKLLAKQYISKGELANYDTDTADAVEKDGKAKETADVETLVPAKP
eukprot:COSAG01_NODE_175_length_22996_cov_18.857892_14_plen_1178_part_00